MLKLRLVDTREDGEAPLRPAKGGTMKVAFATGDLHTLDAHFAGARTFAIYDVGPDGHRFIEAVRFDEASNQDGMHADEGDRLAARIDAIDGCAIVFVLAIGGPAAARVVARKIHPVKLPKPEPITEILERIRTMLNGTPPPWLRKAMKGAVADADSFLDEEDEARA